MLPVHGEGNGTGAGEARRGVRVRGQKVLQLQQRDAKVRNNATRLHAKKKKILLL